MITIRKYCHGGLKLSRRAVIALFSTVFAVFFCATQLVACQKEVIEYQQEAIEPINAPFKMPELQRPTIPNRKYDIRKFGALEGGIEKNTEAIRKTIEAATQEGGGVVVIPKGKWLTGAIHLDNNINLYLEKDAELLFSQDTKDYLPVVFSRHEDIECYKYSAFIYADGKTNIAITGEGTLNGQGKPWWILKDDSRNMEPLLNQMVKDGVPVEKRIFDGTGGKELRPAFFQPMRCKNILVEGVTFLYGAFWTITPTYCENVIVRRVHIKTEGDYGHTFNGDGVNPSSTKNVLIEYCVFDTGDDCIAIKAGRDQDGLRVNMPTENIVIRHCKGFHGHGGVVIGSETSGSIRNVYATDCQYVGTERVIRLKTARGRGGILENMWFKNITADSILKEAIRINMLYTGKRLPEQPITETTPIIRNINFENITCLSGQSYGLEILGLPEMMVKDISFTGININAAKGINISDASNITLLNSHFQALESPLFTITDGSDIKMDSVTFDGKDEAMLKVNGKKSKNIGLRKTNIKQNKKTVVFGSDASETAVVFDE